MADDTDLAAIRDWVAAGGKIGVDKEGNPVLPSGVLADEGLTQTTPATPAASAAQTADMADMTPQQADQARLARDEARAAQRKAPKPAPQAKKQEKGAGFGLLGRLSDALATWAANMPTPGGNLALLLILLFFAFAIIPVNAGKTRLQLIWLVLTGGADLPGQGAASGPTAQQASSALQAGATGGALAGTGLGTVIGGGLVGGLIPTLTGSGGGPGGPNAAGYIPPSQQSGAGSQPGLASGQIGGYSGLLESPR